VSAPKVDVLFALDQADTALMVAGLKKSSIFRMELRAARTAVAELIEACAPAVTEEGMTQDELNRLRAALARIGGES
jgi:hypothetical protein